MAKKAKKRKYSKSASKEVKNEMHRYKRGKAKSGRGGKSVEITRAGQQARGQQGANDLALPWWHDRAAADPCKGGNAQAECHSASSHAQLHRNSPVRFLGEGARVTGPPYPTQVQAAFSPRRRNVLHMRFNLPPTPLG